MKLKAIKEKILGMKHYKFITAGTLVLIVAISGALVFLQSASATDKKVIAELNLGAKYLVDGKYQEAILAYNNVIKIDKKIVEAYKGLSATYGIMGQYEKADQALSQGINNVIKTEKTDLKLLSADLAIKKGESAESIIKLYTNVISGDPLNIDAYKKLAQYYVSQNKYEKALSLIDEGIKQNLNKPGAIDLYNVSSRILLSENRKDEALAQLLKALDADIDFSGNYATLTYLYGNDWDELLTKSQDIAPTNAKIGLMLRLFALVQEENYDDAISVFEKNPDMLSKYVRGSLMAATAYHRKKLDNKADELMKKINVSSIKDATVLDDLSKYYLETGNLKIAQDLTKKAIQLDPNNPNNYFLLYKASGDQNLLGKMLVNSGDSSGASLALANIMVIQKKTEMALEYFKQAADTSVISNTTLASREESVKYNYDIVKQIVNNSGSLIAPVINKPNDQEQYSKSDVTVIWDPNSSVTNFSIAVRDLTTNNLIVPEIKLGTKTSYTISSSSLTEGHQYKVAVGADNGKGEQKWSEAVFGIYVKSVVVGKPIITNPLSNSLYDKADINVMWNSVNNAVNYRISVKDLTSNAYVLLETSIRQVNKFTIDNALLTAGHQYKVAVAAEDAQKSQQWSEMQFSLKGNISKISMVDESKVNTNIMTVLNKPVVIYPSNGGTYRKGDLNISWNSVNGAGSYRIAVRDLTTDSLIVSETDIDSSTSYKVNASQLSEGHNYRVAVAAQDISGNRLWTEVLFSIMSSVSMNIASPQVMFPVNGASYSKSNISVKWDSVAGASLYRIALRDLTTNSIIVTEKSVSMDTSYTVNSSQLADGHQYRVAVAAENSSGNQGWTEVVFSLTTLLPPPQQTSTITAPVVSSPIQGQTYSKKDMNIKWNSVTGAAKFQIAARDLISGDLITQATDVGLTTSYTITANKFIEGHQYRVAVGVFDSAGNQKWTEIVFSILNPTPPPPQITAPVVLFPSNGVSLNKADLNVKWNSVTGAGSFRISARDLTTNSMIVSETNIGLSTNYTINSNNLTAGHQYRVAVGTFDTIGTSIWTEILFSISNPTPATTLTKPVVTSPASGGSYNKGDINVRWNNVSGASTYRIAVRDLNTDTLIVPEVNIGSSTSYTIYSNKFTADHQYRVAVGAFDSNGNEIWTEVIFAITAPTPIITSPVVNYPASGGSYDKGNINVSWNAVSGVSTYRLAVRNLITDSLIVSEQDVGLSTSYSISSSKLTVGHQYKVAIGAFDTGGNQKWTEVIFSITAPPQIVTITPPDVKYPDNGGSYDKGNINVSWNSVSGASTYRIAVRNLITNSLIVSEQDIGLSTSYNVSSSKLTAGHQYKVAIGAFDSNGNQKWTEVIFSITAPPPIVTITPPDVKYPDNGGSYDKGNINVSWNSVSGASKYRIAVRDLITDSLIVSEQDIGLSTSYNVSSSKLTAGHQYRVAVGAFDSNGNQKWTEVIFNIKNAPPPPPPPITSPNVTYPSNGSSYSKANLNVRWNSQSGASSYRIAVRDLTTNNLIVTETNVGLNTSYTITSSKFISGHQYRVAVVCADNSGTEKWTEVVFSIK